MRCGFAHPAFDSTLDKGGAAFDGIEAADTDGAMLAATITKALQISHTLFNFTGRV